MRKILLGGASSRRPTVKRAPLVLPACGSCPSPLSYDKTLPWVPPQGRDFLRANAFTVVVPNLPFVPGGSREHPERMLTGFLYKYPRNMWDACFNEYGKRGYRQWPLWWPNARAEGVSLQAFAGICSTLRENGFWPQVGINSKDFDPLNAPLSYWSQTTAPLFAALNGLVDEYAVWEWDSHNIPGASTISILKMFGQRAHVQGASFWAHFFPGHTWWGAADGGPDRYSFWDALGTDVDGLDYQADPGWDIGQLQARLVDTLNQFAQQGNVHKLRAKELRASVAFTQDRPNEDEDDAFGYLACCTNASAPVWGYGNGGRALNGDPL